MLSLQILMLLAVQLWAMKGILTVARTHPTHLVMLLALLMRVILQGEAVQLLRTALALSNCGCVGLLEPQLCTQMTIVCPFHREADDRAGTKCTKAIGFRTRAEQQTAILRLKQWALAGRECCFRARSDCRPQSHKFLDPSTLALDGEDVQQSKLAIALREPSWIIDLPDPHPLVS